MGLQQALVYLSAWKVGFSLLLAFLDGYPDGKYHFNGVLASLLIRTRTFKAELPDKVIFIINAVERSRLPFFGSICPGMDGIRAMQEQLPREARLLL